MSVRMLKNGPALEGLAIGKKDVLSEGHVRRPGGYWKDRDNALGAIRKMVVESGKEARDIVAADFRNAGLFGMLCFYYEGSPYKALLDAGLVGEADKEHMVKKKWSHERRVRAIKEMVEKSGKEADDITVADFRNAGLFSVLGYYYRGSPYDALLDAGLVRDADRKQMRKSGPKGHEKKYGDLERRAEAIRKMVKETGKQPVNIIPVDFRNAGLRGMLEEYYGGSPFLALLDAGIVRGADCRLMKKKRLNKWTEENGIPAIRKMVEKSGKRPEEITGKDFNQNGLCGLLQGHYGGSPYAALKAAGFGIRPWEMSMAPNGFWKNRENRIDAMKWLFEKLGKETGEISRRDFNENGLRGVLKYYGNSARKALLDAGLVTKADEAYMRSNQHTKSSPASEGVEN